MSEPEPEPEQPPLGKSDSERLDAIAALLAQILETLKPA